jgi:hypothetical protein
MGVRGVRVSWQAMNSCVANYLGYDDGYDFIAPRTILLEITILVKMCQC